MNNSEYLQLLRHACYVLVPGLVLYGIYWRNIPGYKKPAPSRVALSLLFLAYLSGVLSMTIIPSERFGLNNTISLLNYIPGKNTLHDFKVNWYARSWFNWKIYFGNLLGNIVMFIPLGAFLKLLYNYSFRKTVFIAFLAAFCIELTQYIQHLFHYYRDVDIDDVMLNTLGAATGYWLFQSVVALRLLSRRLKIGKMAA